MYAIVEIAGVQFKAEESKILNVPKMDVEPGKSITLDKVLLIADKDNVQIGKPFVANAQVKAKVIDHGRDKKVIVFKKKRRKTYQVKNGHRQQLTELQIEKISVVKAAADEKKEPAKAASEDKKVAPKRTAAKPAAKVTAEKKAPAKTVAAKPAAKKAPAKKAAPKKQDES